MYKPRKHSIRADIPVSLDRRKRRLNTTWPVVMEYGVSALELEAEAKRPTAPTVAASITEDPTTASLSVTQSPESANDTPSESESAVGK